MDVKDALMMIGLFSFIIIVIILFITMLHWLFDINWDACEAAGRGVYECIDHPIRYTLAEVLQMEWDWIFAHKVI